MKRSCHCSSPTLCCSVRWTVGSSHYMLWVLSHFNPFVTSTKLHVKESLWLLLHWAARSMRSDPSWWLESRWGPTVAAGTGTLFTSIQNGVLMRLSSLQVNAMLRGHLVSRLFQVNSYLWGELHDCHGPQAGWYPISNTPFLTSDYTPVPCPFLCTHTDSTVLGQGAHCQDGSFPRGFYPW